MIWRGKEGLTDNKHPVAKMENNKMGAAIAQQISSDAETVILSSELF